jgi:hypothetical protein
MFGFITKTIQNLIAMASIKIKRSNELFQMTRKYEIYIDGDLVGKIKRGEVMEFPTTEGQHMVMAKTDQISSPKISISVNASETKCLTVGSLKIFKWIHLLSFVFLVVLLMLKPPVVFYFIFFLFMAIPDICCVIGRKKYLNLTEVS